MLNYDNRCLPGLNVGLRILRVNRLEPAVAVKFFQKIQDFFFIRALSMRRFCAIIWGAFLRGFSNFTGFAKGTIYSLKVLAGSYSIDRKRLQL